MNLSWPNDSKRSIVIDEEFQIEWISSARRSDTETCRFRLRKGNEQSRIIEQHRIKRWTENEFRIDPLSLLRVQCDVAANEETRKDSQSVIGIHCPPNDVDHRALTYLLIDLNRRLLISYGFINILRTFKMMKDQKRKFKLNRTVLINTYRTLLHFLAWDFSGDITDMKSLNNRMKNFLSDRFSFYHYNPVRENYRVRSKWFRR